MFSQEEFAQEVWGEFIELAEDPQEVVWGDAVGPVHLIDPAMDQYGPHLQDELDMQEWQKLACAAFPQGAIDDHGKAETCLRLQRKTTPSGGIYYTAIMANSWGQHDYKEMEEAPRPTRKAKPRELPESEEPGTSAPIREIKTRIQITLKRKSKNVRGETGNFVVYQVKAADLKRMFEPLLSTYPKQRKSEQVVRVQFTEYRISGGNYRKECGANLNLHNAKVSVIVAYIHDAIKRHKWDYTSTVGERKGQAIGLLIAQEVAKSPAAMSADQFYDPQKHSGLWCLCKIKDGKSLVLETASEVAPIVLSRGKNDGFTYIINPKGGMLLPDKTKMLN